MNDVPLGLARQMVEKYSIDPDALNDAARATLDQAQSFVRDLFDEFEAPLTDPVVAYHAIGALIVIVECARHGATTGAVDPIVAENVAALSRIAIAAFAGYLPSGARR